MTQSEELLGIGAPDFASASPKHSMDDDDDDDETIFEINDEMSWLCRRYKSKGSKEKEISLDMSEKDPYLSWDDAEKKLKLKNIIEITLGKDNPSLLNEKSSLISSKRAKKVPNNQFISFIHTKDMDHSLELECASSNQRYNMFMKVLECLVLVMGCEIDIKGTAEKVKGLGRNEGLFPLLPLRKWKMWKLLLVLLMRILRI